MKPYTYDEVAMLAKAAGIKWVKGADLVEVTHRLNFIIQGVEKFEHPDIDATPPVATYPLNEEPGHGK
ncbi:MAG: hypothetical protein FJ320_00855 [SAR202 cluster bacterium]|nr:hypothetical protein [SAR202 cluster bacterium]